MKTLDFSLKSSFKSEQDTRMLRPLRGLPPADMISMGNVGNVHSGAWSARHQGALRQQQVMVAGDLRRQRPRAVD